MILTFSVEKITLAIAKVVKVGNNNATTKLTTAQPSRHSMAIFMPNTFQTVLSTGVNTTVFHNFTPCNFMRIVGLITQNTIPILGNMRSRLLAVVETQHHLFLNGTLTKLTGAFLMLKTIDLNKVNQHIKKAFTSDENFSKMKFSQKQIAVMPNREFLAFFMPKNRKLVNPTFIQHSQDKTIISQAHSLVRNVGATSQNKAFSQICGAVAICTESEPQHHFIKWLFLKNQIGAFIMLKTYLLNSFYVFVSLIATSVFVLVVWFLLIVILGA